MVGIGKDEGCAQVDRRRPCAGCRIGYGTGMNRLSGHALRIALGHENSRESRGVERPRRCQSILACSPVWLEQEDRRSLVGAIPTRCAADECLPTVDPTCGPERRGRPTDVFRTS